MELTNFQEVVAFALEREKDAVEFYRSCMDKVPRREMKDALQEMAEEEEKHVRMLENLKIDHVEESQIDEIPNLKISDYLVDMAFDPDMNYRDLLILAMKREESAYNLYQQFASKSSDPRIKKLFEVLAQEELKHKNRFETEYDEHVFQED